MIFGLLAMSTTLAKVKGPFAGTNEVEGVHGFERRCFHLTT